VCRACGSAEHADTGASRKIAKKSGLSFPRNQKRLPADSGKVMPWKISSPLGEESRNLNLSEQNQSARRLEGLSIRGSTVLRKKDTGSNIKETFGESPRL